MRIGVVDVGGGLRGVYAAGIFDRCLDEKIHFDVCIGVSAGSANCTSYMAGKKKRNYPFYTDYPFRKEYMSPGNFIRKKSYLDLDYVYETLSNADGENPLDYPALMANPAELIVVATDAVSGKPWYFTKADMAQDDYSMLKASSAIPVVCHPYWVKGLRYYDGALGDPIPVQKAFELGCDKVVLILTKPRGVLREPGKDPLFARFIRREYPNSAEKLRLRAQHYNEGIEKTKALEAQGKVLIVASDDTCGVDTLTKDKGALMRLYEKGYRDGEQILTII